MTQEQKTEHKIGEKTFLAMPEFIIQHSEKEQILKITYLLNKSKEGIELEVKYEYKNDDAMSFHHMPFAAEEAKNRFMYTLGVLNTHLWTYFKKQETYFDEENLWLSNQILVNMESWSNKFKEICLTL